MAQAQPISYLELPVRDMAASQDFFRQIFNWEFIDYGPDYASFTNAGVAGGFYRSELSARTEQGSALVVFYSADLEPLMQQVVAAGGTIAKAPFDFPGGRRFHFFDPSGNEFAVWSEQS
ncbi:VOC family protein [Ferrimonas pelagia]